MFKIACIMTPSYLTSKLPPRKRQYLFSAGESLSFRQPRCRTSRYLDSFQPNGISTQNNVIGNFDSMPSIGVFKAHMLSFIRPHIKSTYGIHDPLGLRFLFMLRLNLSPLRSHKFHHNFLDTPSANCPCASGVEDTYHFLLACPLFSNERETLFRTTEAILNKANYPGMRDKFLFFLYGNHLLSNDDNRFILLSTIKFIKDTKRFSN